MARKYVKTEKFYKKISDLKERRYQIYLEKRRALEEQGYVLRPVTQRELFEKRYQNAKKAGINNFMRDYPMYDRYSNKTNFYQKNKKLKSLDVNDDLQREVYNRYINVSWDEMKNWDNKDWTNFLNDLLDVGITYEEFRGIYE